VTTDFCSESDADALVAAELAVGLAANEEDAASRAGTRQKIAGRKRREWEGKAVIKLLERET
jgi:hypothetical protein